MASKFFDTAYCASRFSDFTADPYQILPPIQGYEKKPKVSLEEAIKPIKNAMPDIDHMVHIVKKKCVVRKTDLSLNESAAIMLYTLEWSPSETSFYVILNNTLRSKNRRELVPWFSYLRLLLSALSKLPPCTPRLLYRGVDMDQGELYNTDDDCIWWSFSSCTTSLRVLKGFIAPHGSRTIFNIHCRSAIDISQYSFHPTENEVLLYPGRQFRLCSSLDAGNGLRIIELEETEPPFPLFRIPTEPSINILMLGEAGVGKTTFINAFVNYLKFPTIRHAQTGSTAALIPLSFDVTLDDSFQQRTVRLGDAALDNPLDRQRCQSYSTDLHQADGTKLCIIDTPSFQNTQENNPLESTSNMKRIADYLNELTHLDAICLILKANETCFNTLQSNFNRLIPFLGPAANRNIIFCFTHARAAFFTPGSTAGVLRRILNAHSMEDTPFSRENSFFFDNETFRCLLVLKDGIHLDNINLVENSADWSQYVAESNRLLQYIRTQLTPIKITKTQSV